MKHSMLIIAVAAAVTMALRFLPFIIFGGKREPPALVTYLGRVLPYAIMAMLVVYCLRHMSFAAVSGFAPQLIACAVVAALHVWKRNSIISILGGTACYMLLTQLVF